MNLQDFMKEIDGAWPQGMPPEQLDVAVRTEDQVLLDIKGLTLQLINDVETVVIEFEPIDHDNLTLEQLDQMGEYIAKLKKSKKDNGFKETVAQPIADEFNKKFGAKDAPESEPSSGSRTGGTLAEDSSSDEGEADEDEAGDASAVPAGSESNGSGTLSS